MSFAYDYSENQSNEEEGVGGGVAVGTVVGGTGTGTAPVSQSLDTNIPPQSTSPQSIPTDLTVDHPLIVSGSPPSPTDSKSTLWMGELEPWYDENSVRKIWQTFGENVTVKLIRDKFSGVNAGYCFVDFGNAQAAAKALNLNGQPIPNTQRVFRLNWASGGGLIDKRDDRGPEFSIFVGDLSPEITELNLLQLFQSRYSSCKSAKIMTDPSTNQSRGYGFVRFSDESHMQRALAEMQGFFLGNRPIRISTATPKSKPGQNNNLLPGTNGNNLYHSHQLVPPPPPAGYYGTPQTLNQFTDPNNTTVFVGGLSGHVSEDELRRYFSGFGDITYVRIPPGKGCGFVQFVQRHSAEAAITQMQGYPIGNSRVRLSWGRSQNAAAVAAAAVGMSGMNGLGPGIGGPNNNGPPPGPYRPAPPPPGPYPQLTIPTQAHYGPYGPINHIQGQVDINQQQVILPPNTVNPGNPSTGAATTSTSAATTTTTGQDPLLPLGQDPSEPVPVARLNELYLAARDGRLDRMEADGRGYHGVYAQ